MTAPRKIDSNSTFYVSVRAVNRSFRFVPKATVREAMAFCLAAVLQKYRELGKIQLHEWVVMSNHYHLLGTDLGACLPDFMRELDALISRQLNSMRGISGSNFEKDYGHLVVGDDERVAEHAVYTLINPVRAFLVARAQHWPGLSSARMRYGVPVAVARPRSGLWLGKQAHAKRGRSKRSGRAAYAGRSKFPDAAELVIDRPPVMLELSDDELRDAIIERVAEREQELAEVRREEHIKLPKRTDLERRHFNDLPGAEELFARRPTFSATEKRSRVALAGLRKAFLRAYYAARDRLFGGERNVTFPEGTWLWRCRFGVACHPFVTG